MRRPFVNIIVSVVAAAAVGAASAYYSVHGSRTYGFALFFLVPAAVGFIVVALMRFSGPQPLTRCLGVPFFSAILLSLLPEEGAGRRGPRI